MKKLNRIIKILMTFRIQLYFRPKGDGRIKVINLRRLLKRLLCRI